ncbi:PAS domain S-box-containing protein [Noviherbaspirillum humi]|uniref:PAS domain S-box-containing protein n=1 Tax=Noviherbaspirillum humi TaxID=1688639 RepID=A0A239G0Q4_9BURK|nr:sensor histidine kinase [Noviherbaspirillum humi]SNS62043.1 PAS domain S-box-containing protein [Noviherbaspirillum humi]
MPPVLDSIQTDVDPRGDLMRTDAPASGTNRQEIMQAEWLPIVMQGTFNEIYVVEPHGLRLVQVNDAGRRNLQFRDDELRGMTLADLNRDCSLEELDHRLAAIADGLSGSLQFDTVHVRRDGSCYPVEYRISYCAAAEKPVYIVIGNDISARQESERALQLSEARIQAMVSHTPGLVYQFLLRDDGSVSFPYLSDGCEALLGISAERLRANSRLFLELILPEDRPSYLESMQASATGMKAWNWEGRLWIEKWKDIKWINLRSTPRALAGQGIQWEGIMTNITQSKLEEAEIKRSRAQLAELSAHIQTVKENERTRIAREIHDDLGGNLTAIKMAMTLLARRLSPEDAELAEKASYVNSLIDRTIEAVHRITVDLRPGILDFGIVAAIDWQAKEFEKHAGIPCSFTCNKKDIELHNDQATALFRIFQEALTNIGKHAQASEVRVKLARTNRGVHLEVCDNGRGIATTDRLKPKSFGIRGMAERASALGGSLTVGSAPGGGCMVSLRIPLAARAG